MQLFALLLALAMGARAAPSTYQPYGVEIKPVTPKQLEHSQQVKGTTILDRMVDEWALQRSLRCYFDLAALRCVVARSGWPRENRFYELKVHVEVPEVGHQTAWSTPYIYFGDKKNVNDNDALTQLFDAPSPNYDNLVTIDIRKTFGEQYNAPLARLSKFKIAQPLAVAQFPIPALVFEMRLKGSPMVFTQTVQADKNHEYCENGESGYAITMEGELKEEGWHAEVDLEPEASEKIKSLNDARLKDIGWIWE
ncbi:hypothetical protein RJ55_00147 [Drechmeria coniospora]|nr:hypothetical protein RJ55_00147 [Drechmeria coniospora]